MDKNFSIKDNKVYFEDKLLKGISAENFEILTMQNGANQSIIKGLKDKKGIWFFHQRGGGIVKFLTSDFDNFSFINLDYARDKNNVYLNDKDGFLIPNADPDSFEVIAKSPHFSKDKNQLYALGGSGLHIYRYADCESIVDTNGSQFITDKHNLYNFSYTIEITNDQIYLNYLDHSFPYEKRKNTTAFQSNKAYFCRLHPNLIGWWHKDYPYKIDIENITKLGFYKTKNAIFFIEYNKHRRKISHNIPNLVLNADYNSFKEISKEYGIDNKNVFYKSLPIKDADVKTFKIIDDYLSKDKNNYYFNGNMIDCDYDSFEKMNEKGFFYKDKNSLFSEKEIRLGSKGVRYEIVKTLVSLKNSSASTLKIFSSAWAKDDNQVYRYGEVFKKADVNTFEYLDINAYYDWAKDKNNLYSSSVKKIMKGIDAPSFKAFNDFWGKDKNNVFFFNTERILPSADVKTFKITDEKGGATDKNFIYSVNKSGVLKKRKTKFNALLNTKHIEIYADSRMIINCFADAIVVPVDEYLGNAIENRFILATIEHRCYHKHLSKISEDCPYKSGETFIIEDNECLESEKIILCVLPKADADNKIAKEKIIQFYTNIFDLAVKMGLKELSIPSFCEPIFKYDISIVVEEGLRIASLYPQINCIRFFCFNESYFNLFTEKLNQLLKNEI